MVGRTEILRENQRALKKAMRELDRERTSMQRSEKKIIADIKKAAKDNQMGAAKVMAKDLVRTRKYIQKFYQMRTQLQAVSLRIQTLKSQQAMAQAMVGVTKAMRSMNQQLNMPQIQAIMMEFERQTEISEAKQEMMEDVMDDVMDSEDDEAEEDAILGQVMDELGLDIASTLDAAPSGSLVSAPPTSDAERTPVAANADSDLQDRLNNLRR